MSHEQLVKDGILIQKDKYEKGDAVKFQKEDGSWSFGIIIKSCETGYGSGYFYDIMVRTGLDYRQHGSKILSQMNINVFDLIRKKMILGE